MIPFPIGFPDEIFYSICARFKAWMPILSSIDVNKLLFSNKYAVVSIDLPSRLQYLVNNLQDDHPLNVMTIIKKHTLYPFYSPCLSEKQAERVVEEMRSENTHAHNMIGRIRTYENVKKDMLFYCNKCFEEDRKNYPEAYWHRIHQAPGVFFCPKHSIRLHHVNLKKICAIGREKIELFSADELISKVQGISNCEETDISTTDIILINIAQSVEWLINQKNFFIDSDLYISKIRTLLYKKGLARLNGIVISSKDFHNAFISFYSQDLLNELGCSLIISNQSWLARLCKKHYSPFPFTLHLILLVIFLGYSLNDFHNLQLEEISYNASPFGSGPWNCLNPVCKHHQKPVIRNASIRTRYFKETITVEGVFGCECGFTYSQTYLGSNLTPGQTRKGYTVLDYGNLWKTKFRELYERVDIPLKEVGKILGIYPRSVHKHAARYGFPIIRSNINGETKIDKKLRSGEVPNDNQSDMRNKYLRILNENPNAIRTEIRKKDERVYRWLKKYDFDWLEDNLPPEKYTSSGKVTDWDSRDQLFAKEIPRIAEEIRNLSNPLVRITIRSIFNKIGGEALSWRNKLLQEPSCMPISKTMMRNVVETWHQFKLRSIDFYIGYYIDFNVVPTLTEFILKVGLGKSYYVAKNQELVTAVHDALSEISKGK